MGGHYGADSSSPTHAALVNRQAREDGINPYTSQPINSVDNHAIDGAAAAGIGGVAGVAGSEAYRHYEEDYEAKYRQEQEQQAALESSIIAAPDTYEQESEQRAAQEASFVSSPDIPLASTASTTNFMSSGRSQGGVSTISAEKTKTQGLGLAERGIQANANPLATALKPITEDLVRPSLAAGQNHQSVQSISQLHVPGEFPRSNTEPKDAVDISPA